MPRLNSKAASGGVYRSRWVMSKIARNAQKIPEIDRVCWFCLERLFKASDGFAMPFGLKQIVNMGMEERKVIRFKLPGLGCKRCGACFMLETCSCNAQVIENQWVIAPDFGGSDKIIRRVQVPAEEIQQDAAVAGIFPIVGISV